MSVLIPNDAQLWPTLATVVKTIHNTDYGSRLRSLFKRMDRNGDYRLSPQELFDGLRVLGVGFQDARGPLAEQVFSFFDAQGKGSVSLSAFIKAIGKLSRRLSQDSSFQPDFSPRPKVRHGYFNSQRDTQQPSSTRPPPPQTQTLSSSSGSVTEKRVSTSGSEAGLGAGVGGGSETGLLGLPSSAQRVTSTGIDSKQSTAPRVLVPGAFCQFHQQQRQNQVKEGRFASGQSNVSCMACLEAGLGPVEVMFRREMISRVVNPQSDSGKSQTSKSQDSDPFGYLSMLSRGRAGNDRVKGKLLAAPVKLSDLQSRFDQLDKDGNGVLTVVEIQGVLLEAGLARGPAKRLAQSLMQRFDANKNGLVSFHEFRDEYVRLQLLRCVRYLIGHMGDSDVNSDGQLGFTEFGNTLRIFLGCGLRTAKSMASKCFTALDKSGDDKVTLDELVSWYVHSENEERRRQGKQRLEFLNEQGASLNAVNNPEGSARLHLLSGGDGSEDLVVQAQRNNEKDKTDNKRLSGEQKQASEPTNDPLGRTGRSGSQGQGRELQGYGFQGDNDGLSGGAAPQPRRSVPQPVSKDSGGLSSVPTGYGEGSGGSPPGQWRGEVLISGERVDRHDVPPHQNPPSLSSGSNLPSTGSIGAHSRTREDLRSQFYSFSVPPDNPYIAAVIGCEPALPVPAPPRTVYCPNSYSAVHKKYALCVFSSRKKCLVCGGTLRQAFEAARELE